MSLCVELLDGGAAMNFKSATDNVIPCPPLIGSSCRSIAWGRLKERVVLDRAKAARHRSRRSSSTNNDESYTLRQRGDE